MEPLNWANPDDRKKIKDHLFGVSGQGGTAAPPAASAPQPDDSPTFPISAPVMPVSTFPAFPKMAPGTGIPAAPVPGSAQPQAAPSLPASTWTGGAPDQGTQDAQKVANWKLQQAMQFANTNNGAASLFTDPADQFNADQAKTASRNAIVRDMMATTAGQSQDEQAAAGLKQKQWETTANNKAALDRVKAEVAGKKEVAGMKDPNHSVHADMLLKLAALKSQNPNMKFSDLATDMGSLTQLLGQNAPGSVGGKMGKAMAAAPLAGLAGIAGGAAGATAPAVPVRSAEGLGDDAIAQLRTALGKQVQGAGGGSSYQVDPAKLTSEGLSQALPGIAGTFNALTPEAKAYMAKEMASGRAIGDPSAILAPLAQHFARNQLIAGGTPAVRTDPNWLDRQLGLPGAPQAAGNYQIMGSNGPLMSLEADQMSGAGRLAAGLGSLIKGSKTAVPYDRIRLSNGQVVPFDRAGIGGIGTLFDNDDARKKAAIEQTGAASPLLEAILSGGR